MDSFEFPQQPPNPSQSQTPTPHQLQPPSKSPFQAPQASQSTSSSISTASPFFDPTTMMLQQQPHPQHILMTATPRPRQANLVIVKQLNLQPHHEYIAVSLEKPKKQTPAKTRASSGRKTPHQLVPADESKDDEVQIVVDKGVPNGGRKASARSKRLDSLISDGGELSQEEQRLFKTRENERRRRAAQKDSADRLREMVPGLKVEKNRKVGEGQVMAKTADYIETSIQNKKSLESKKKVIEDLLIQYALSQLRVISFVATKTPQGIPVSSRLVNKDAFISALKPSFSATTQSGTLDEKTKQHMENRLKEAIAIAKAGVARQSTQTRPQQLTIRPPLSARFIPIHEVPRHQQVQLQQLTGQLTGQLTSQLSTTTTQMASSHQVVLALRNQNPVRIRPQAPMTRVITPQLVIPGNVTLTQNRVTQTQFSVTTPTPQRGFYQIDGKYYMITHLRNGSAVRFELVVQPGTGKLVPGTGTVLCPKETSQVAGINLNHQVAPRAPSVPFVQEPPSPERPLEAIKSEPIDETEQHTFPAAIKQEVSLDAVKSEPFDISMVKTEAPDDEPVHTTPFNIGNVKQETVDISDASDPEQIDSEDDSEEEIGWKKNFIQDPVETRRSPSPGITPFANDPSRDRYAQAGVRDLVEQMFDATNGTLKRVGLPQITEHGNPVARLVNVQDDGKLNHLFKRTGMFDKDFLGHRLNNPVDDKNTEELMKQCWKTAYDEAVKEDKERQEELARAEEQRKFKRAKKRTDDDDEWKGKGKRGGQRGGTRKRRGGKR